MTETAGSEVQLSGVTRAYPEGDGVRRVLDGVSATLAPGSITALVGPSGCGKSTLLNLIAGIDPPDGGSITIGGTDLTGLDETARTRFRRRHIGLVFQFFNLLPTLTVAENVLLPQRLDGRDDEAMAERARVLLSDLGLAGREGEWPEHLSGGEQQRVAIARALAGRPRLLLADEPTGNLDGETAEAVADSLVALAERDGVTVLLVTHSDELARRAHRRLTLRAGQLTEA
ncbi:MAG: ABC transporter ATP-binding protein [Thiohalospira sp.]